MLRFALLLLAAAAALGAGLAIRRMARAGQALAATPLPASVALLHGVLGALGLAALLAALGRGVAATGMGTAGFGPLAALLLGLALVLGLALARRSGRRRPPPLLLETHAGLAIAGLVLLLALVALR
jgi:hypothetical protein